MGELKSLINEEEKMKKPILGKVLQKHPLAMIICCAVPLIQIGILSLTGALSSCGLYALIFLCPLLHLFIMRWHTQPSNGAKLLSPPTDDTEKLSACVDIMSIQRQLKKEDILNDQELGLNMMDSQPRWNQYQHQSGYPWVQHQEKVCFGPLLE